MTSHQIPEFFINAFYESKFKDNFFVIKVGGKVIENTKHLDNLLSNIRELTHKGIKVLLVYGGGRAMDEEAKKRGVEVKKVEGRRVTDAAAMQIMRHVVAGDLSLSVASAMARVKLEGISLNAVPVDWMNVAMRSKKPVDYGYVGDVLSVHARPINRLFRFTNFVVCACLATAEDGTILNINADTVATQLAIGVQAHKLMFLSDVDGVIIHDKVAAIITDKQIDELIADGTATGGMRVKLENCKAALRAGVRRIHLLSGLREDALKKEIYESFGPGTMLFTESERKSYENELETQKLIEGRK
ncbi:MAG: acetylglutamate kinase [Alphaproteobacteria bacterium]|nr:acetylglutamate kinase [Alphaproteobacteria bacterium]